MKNARVGAAVTRDLLFAALGIPDKIPPLMAGVYPNVTLENRWRPTPLGVFTVIIKRQCKAYMDDQRHRPLRRIKSSQHRVFVLCDCKREVPFGRLHMHVCNPRRSKPNA